ncbi:hypothetical protein [Shouchella clausii]|uniref:hypothetical protein n=1 Tax=Shouchella clausii TaxID=79880 RepID=UPI000BA7CCF9|nr:hypothetical protein [Shouchella clausii]PAD91429.1 hypothetical protein CHH52_14900 [Shouchella clausii]
MIQIETYIAKTNSLDEYYENLEEPSQFFINKDDDTWLKVLDKMLNESKGSFLNGTIFISIEGAEVVTFIDWDDLDLMWPALLTMVLDFLNDGKYARTEHFSNGQQWTIRKVTSSPKDMILFKVVRDYSIFEFGLNNLTVNKETSALCKEDVFLKSVIGAAQEYIDYRDKDSRSQNLVDAKQKLRNIKERMGC